MDHIMDICQLAATIEANIKKSINYSDLEEIVGYSYHHIRDFFKQTANVSLYRYILARKIANAAFDIRHTGKSITAIALEYGFHNIETFARAFGRIAGLTPSQFRQSGYLCGRRIICPGVYAPVILGHDNPMLTLQHIKEVNKMGEMKKTADSCVLYGVPKVYYGREVDGQRQNRPFPMCLQSVLNYMGQNIGYTELMAYCGTAFRQRIDSYGWNIATGDIRFTYESRLKAFELGFKGAGRSVKISEDFKAVKKEDAFTLIKSEIDCGRPVIALGVVGPPEACIVTGYRNNGDTLLGWSLFQDKWGGCGFDESGYFIKHDWWTRDYTQAIMSVGEEIISPTSDNQVLENALMLMTTEKMPAYEGHADFYGGQAAYEEWAKALEDDASFTDAKRTEEISWCQGDAEVMLGEGRSFGSVYMYQLAEKHPAAAAELKECARLLSAAAECVPKMWEARSKGMQDKATRARLAELVRQAARHEKEACVALKAAIGKM